MPRFEDCEHDIDFDHEVKKYVVIVDSGNETLYFTRANLQELLDELTDAEDSK